MPLDSEMQLGTLFLVDSNGNCVPWKGIVSIDHIQEAPEIDDVPYAKMLNYVEPFSFTAELDIQSSKRLRKWFKKEINYMRRRIRRWKRSVEKERRQKLKERYKNE